MDVELSWLEPLPLVDGSDEYRVYTLKNEDADSLPDNPGIYIFAREYGAKIIPLYVGMAGNLAARISGQLNNVHLMKGIESAPQGMRLLIIGELRRKPGQKPAKCMRIAESALIEHSLAHGFDILNKQGKKRPTHNIYFTGNRRAKTFSGKQVNIRAIR